MNGICTSWTGLWLAASAVRPEAGRATLVLFAHPRCTRASLNDLAWVLSRARGSVDARVLFYKPAAAAPGCERGSLWDEARALGAQVPADPDGAQEGDGPGREAALAAIDGTLARPAEGPVFGCALIASKAKREEP